MDSIQTVEPYWPAGVVDIIGAGFDYYIGLRDDNTVLKYLQTASRQDLYARQSLDVEARTYKVLGHHPRILEFKGGNSDSGICLEYAENGSVARYLDSHKPVVLQRLKWSLQAAEGVAYIHSRRVLHRDITANNLLLDKDLNVKLADFQGRCVLPDGTHLDGLAVENVKSTMPRSDLDIANKYTDLFALGSAMYFIMEGHEPFPELDSHKDEIEIKSRFQSRRFPPLDVQRGGDIIRKCWDGAYESAQDTVLDMEKLIRISEETIIV